MLVTDKDGKEYVAHIHHMPKANGRVRNHEFRGVTSCRIHAGRCNAEKDKPCDVDTLSYAITRCSIRDQFEKAVGRKIVFTRALRKIFFDDREQRRAMWQSYFSQVKIK